MSFALTVIVWFAIGMWVYLMVVVAIGKLMSLNTRREREMMSHPANKMGCVFCEMPPGECWCGEEDAVEAMNKHLDQRREQERGIWDD